MFEEFYLQVLINKKYYFGWSSSFCFRNIFLIMAAYLLRIWQSIFEDTEYLLENKFGRDLKHVGPNTLRVGNMWRQIIWELHSLQLD